MIFSNSYDSPKVGRLNVAIAVVGVQRFIVTYDDSHRNQAYETVRRWVGQCGLPKEAADKMCQGILAGDM